MRIGVFFGAHKEGRAASDDARGFLRFCFACEERRGDSYQPQQRLQRAVDDGDSERAGEEHPKQQREHQFPFLILDEQVGTWIDISHTLRGLVGPMYGGVPALMKRPRVVPSV